MVDDRTRCKDCYIQKRRLWWKKLKKNKPILIFVGFLWLYPVFSGPFIPGLDPTFYTISLVAALLIMIPVCLALFFWSLIPQSPILRVEKIRLITFHNYRQYMYMYCHFAKIFF